MDQLLERLFESVPKARLLRLFMRNPEQRFRFEEITARSQVRPRTARTELKKLLKIGLVQADISRIELPRKRKGRVHMKRVAVYGVNPLFPFLQELKDLIIHSSAAPRNKLLHQIKGIGRVKLAVLSGIFINSENARTDLLIVGDDIRRRKLDAFLARTESELGKQIQHTVMDTEEFKYRIDMYDRFLRDILEYPHEKLINKLNI